MYFVLRLSQIKIYCCKVVFQPREQSFHFLIILIDARQISLRRAPQRQKHPWYSITIIFGLRTSIGRYSRSAVIFSPAQSDSAMIFLPIPRQKYIFCASVSLQFSFLHPYRVNKRNNNGKRHLFLSCRTPILTQTGN